jgi:hypothetical protein
MIPSLEFEMLALYQAKLEFSRPTSDEETKLVRERLVFLLSHPLILDDTLRDVVTAAGGDYVAMYQAWRENPFYLLVQFEVRDWSAEAREPVVEALRLNGLFVVTDTVLLVDRGRLERVVFRPDMVPPELRP